MSFDYYVSLAESKACPEKVNEASLASGFVDGCTVWSCRDGEKNNARQFYMKRAAELELKLPSALHFEPDFASLPDLTWFGIEVPFTLKSPWYSKDDRPFHVLDNPVHKDRVFGIPFMSAASWKGLLRWVCRMQVGLLDHLKKYDMKMDGWKDPPWILHLFGNEKGEDERFQCGTLVFYPTWFNKIGFEVINPHSRTHRAGTQPIYYEVVPAGTSGRLHLLYAPLPGEIEHDKVNPTDFIDSLVNGIKALLEIYGISAKRTAGWGTAKIENDGWRLYPNNGSNIKTAEDVVTEIKRRYPRCREVAND
jgi:CRISPR-associated protein Cmr2